MIEVAPHPRVLTALADAGVGYTVHQHADCLISIRGPGDFARCLARPIDVVTKTLLLEFTGACGETEFALAVCPVNRRADFATLARSWNCGRLQLASRDRLADRLDYPANGVSPLGCEACPVALDDSLFSFETIFVGAGVAGVELEISPLDLQRACRATRLDFARL